MVKSIKTETAATNNWKIGHFQFFTFIKLSDANYRVTKPLLRNQSQKRHICDLSQSW